MHLNRRQFAATAAAASLVSAPLRSFAQRNSMRVFVGFPPGGLPDLVARAVAEQFRQTFGGPVVVENRPGANGRLAGQAVKNAAPDGTTYLVAPASNIVHLPHVYNDLGYDPLKDFVPVAQLVENDFSFIVSSKIPVTNLKEFAAWCAKNPDKATFGSPGAGSSPHLMGLMLGRALGVKLLHVPYKGSNLAMADVIGGHLTGMMSASASFVVQQHRSGQARILATSGRSRSSTLPQVPTFQEQGVSELTLTEGTWLLAPAGTPSAIVDKASDAAVLSVQGREMQAVIDGQTIASPLGAVVMRRVMQAEYEKRGEQIKSTGFTANS
jgi:tripartite-type tricarboxylate transporter receptor subunit TctC